MLSIIWKDQKTVNECESFDFSLGQHTMLVERFQDNPILLFGMPVSLTAYVLVTSLSPLRAYLHSEGVVQYRHDYQRNFQKVGKWHRQKNKLIMDVNIPIVSPEPKYQFWHFEANNTLYAIWIVIICTEFIDENLIVPLNI